MMAAQDAKKRAEPRDHLVTVSRVDRRNMRDSDGDGKVREGKGREEKEISESASESWVRLHARRG